jgi:AcrR family transcriptional regulator
VAGPNSRPTNRVPRGRSATRASRQAKITQAATEIFWQKGYRATSIRDVAREVGVPAGSIYYYIESKEDLLWHIIEGVREEWVEVLRKASEFNAEPLERIHAFIKLYVEWCVTNMKEVTVFFGEWQHLAGERLNTVIRRRHLDEQVVRDMITAAQDAMTVPRSLDVQYAARYVLAAVNTVPCWYRPSRSDSPGSVADAFAAMTIALLTCTPT